MTIYLVIMGLTLFCGFWGELISRQYKHLGKLFKVVIPIVALYLMASLKDVTVGLDTINYKTVYESMGEYTWSTLSRGNFEIGYMALNKFSYDMGWTWQQFLFFGYFLVFCPLGIVLYWRSETPTTSIMMMFALFLGMWLSGYRQSIAVAIFALGVSCFCSKNFFLKLFGIALAVLGSTIHHSVYLGFILFILYFLKFRKIYIWVFVPFLFVLFFISPYIYEAIYLLFADSIKYIPSIYSGGGLFFAFLAMTAVMILLMEPNKFTVGVDNAFTGIDKGIGRIMPIAEPEKRNDKYFNLALWSMVLLTAVQAFSRTHLTIVRVKDVMAITAAIGFPSIINSFKSKTVRSTLLLLFNGGLFLLTYLSVLKPDYLGIVPYEFYFNGGESPIPPTSISAVLRVPRIV